jgi:L-fucose mutarotase
MEMLKGLNPLLTPDVLYALCAMGHGDEAVIVDAHYPADVAARSSVYGKLLRMDGVAVPEAIRAVLSVLILDTFDEPLGSITPIQPNGENGTHHELIRRQAATGW